MASLVSSSRGGPHGTGTGTDQTYYCFDCDRQLTIIATSDTGIICPICGHLVLEEFETPSSPPPALPPPPPLRSTAFIDLDSFFPTSDTDSDVELYDPLPPPPPPPPPPLPFFLTTPNLVNHAVDRLSQLQIHPPPSPPPSSRSFGNFHYTLDSEVRYLRRPSPSLTDQRPQFSVPSALNFNYFTLPPSERNYSTQYDDVLGEHLVLSPPSRSSDDASELFYSPSRDPEEETPNQPPLQLSPLPSPPPPPPPLPSITNPWDYIFSDIPEQQHQQQSNSPNHEILSDLQPPPPPPWMMMMEDLSDMKMTAELVLDWESHQCSICIDNFELNQIVRLTPCNHLYHTDCLLRWLDLQKSCPICRCKLSYR